MMVAFWIWAVILWIEGLQPRKAWYLAGSGVLIAASALTKYFGAALILLLAAYSLVRLRRLGSWMLYLLIPIGALGGYEFWTRGLYGQGLFLGAAEFAGKQREFGASLSSIDGIDRSQFHRRLRAFRALPSLLLSCLEGRSARF